MAREAKLYGFTNTNSNRKLKDLWSKNVFNSTFPVALALYMKRKGLNAKYITIDANLKPALEEISIEQLFGTKGLSDDAIYYDFESKYDPYDKFLLKDKPLTDKEKTDVVIRRSVDKSPLAALEIKLTVVPEKVSAGKEAKEQGCELVCRPITTKYCTLGIFSKLSPEERKELSDSLAESFRSIHNWNHPDDIKNAEKHLLNLKNALDKFEKDTYDRQSPLIMQPIWRTIGQSPEIDRQHAFDVFVWSDYAYTRLFLDRKFIQERKKIKSLTRTARCMVRVVAFLYEAGRVSDNRADINKIFSDLTVDKQSDREMSATASVTLPYMTAGQSDDNCLLEPRVSRDALKEIILNNGQRYLKPERRLDQSVYFTYRKK